MFVYYDDMILSAYKTVQEIRWTFNWKVHICILDMHAKSRERESERWVLGQWTYEVLIHRNKSRLEMAVLSHSAPSSTTVAWETTGWGQTHTDTFRNWVFRPISSNFFCKRNFRPIFWIFFNLAHVAFLISWPLVITAVLTGTAAILLCRSVGYKFTLNPRIIRKEHDNW